MAIETPIGANVDIEKVLKVINAYAICRLPEWDYLYGYDELPRIDYEHDNWYRKGSCHFIDAEELTVEIMEVIGELADILPCEFYFENHGYKERAEETAYDFDISYIEDDALRRLYYEEMHDQREKISA